MGYCGWDLWLFRGCVCTITIFRPQPPIDPFSPPANGIVGKYEQKKKKRKNKKLEGGHAHLIEPTASRRWALGGGGPGQASALWLRFVAVSWVFTQNENGSNRRSKGTTKYVGNGKFLFMKIKQVNFDRRLPRVWPLIPKTQKKKKNFQKLGKSGCPVACH